MRGTGLRGRRRHPSLRGLSNDEITLVRPLLEGSRVELRRYLQSINESWCEDASNDDTTRTRSRIRHELLPQLTRDYNPRIVDALVRLGKLTRATVKANDERIAALESEIVQAQLDHALVLDRTRLIALSSFDRAEVLRRIWRSQKWPEQGMDAARWRRLASWASGGEGTHDVGESVRLDVKDTTVFLGLFQPKLSVPPPEASRPFGFADAVSWGAGRVETSFNDNVPIIKFDKLFTDEYIDIDKIMPPMRIDSSRPGDRFDPLGMGGKTMALVDFFRGHTGPHEHARLVPIVRDELGIIWVVDHRISHRVRVTEKSKNIGRIQWCNNPQ